MLKTIGNNRQVRLRWILSSVFAVGLTACDSDSDDGDSSAGDPSAGEVEEDSGGTEAEDGGETGETGAEEGQGEESGGEVEDDAGEESGGETDSGEAGGEESGGGMGCDSADPGIETAPEIGDPVAHFEAVDYNGDTFNLCDFAGKPLLVVSSYEGCGACEEFAGDLAGSGGQWASPELTEAVNTQKVVVIEYLTGGDPKAWHDKYPNDNVIVANDHDSRFTNYFTKDDYAPFMGVITPDFRWEFFDPLYDDWGMPGVDLAKDFVAKYF